MRADELLLDAGGERLDQGLGMGRIGRARLPGRKRARDHTHPDKKALFPADNARTVERVGAIAPTLAARTLSMALAGTDDAHDREFGAAAGHYRTAMLNTLNGELASSGRFNTFDYTRGRDLWEKVPPFDYDVPTARWAISQAAWSAGALVAWLVAVSIAASWSVSSMRLE